MSFQQDIELDPVGQSNGYDSEQRQRQYRANSTPSGSGLRHRPRRQNSEPAREQWEQDIMDQLPSRQLGRAGTLRWNRTVRGKRGTSFHQALDQMDTAAIVDNLLQDEDFEEVTLEQKTEEIRDLPTNLANKKSIKARLREADKRKEKKVGWMAYLRSSTFIAWRHFKTNLAELGYAFELWRGHLKVIEGKFGSGVTSYFVFLKWLLLLNIPVCLLLFSFITIPQLLYRLDQPDPYSSNVSFTGVEILTGEGWFRETELYYGVYTNETISRIKGMGYEMPLAYLLTIAAYYLITLIVLLYSLTKSYRKNFIDASDTIKFKFVTKVFSGWDYAIVQDANLKHRSLFIELQEYISTVKNKDSVNRSKSHQCGMLSLRIFTNLLVLGLIAGSGYLVHFITSSDALQVEGEQDTLYGLKQLAIPAVISAIIFILPFAFAIIGDLENFEDPRVGIYLSMVRIILLFCVILGVLVQFWFSRVDNCKSSVPATTSNNSSCPPCWENSLGETIYRLVIVDFLVTLLVTFFSEFVRKLCSLCGSCLSRPEFNIGRNTLYLIYSQTLIWLGTYYSPLLSIIAIIKLVIFFYVKRYSVTGNCRPSVKAWRGGQTHTVIMALLGIALLASFIAVGYSIVRLQPSTICGPYMGMDTAYAVISERVKTLAVEYKAIASLLEFFTSSGFLAGVILAFIILAYYSRIRAKGLDEMVESLKSQIANEIEYKKKLTKILHQQGPAVQKAARRAAKVEDPISPGGRKFAKQNFPANVAKDARGVGKGAASSPGGPPEIIIRDSTGSNTAPGAPKPSSSEGTLQTPGQPTDVSIEGGVDKSWDPQEYEGADPSVNRAYDDRSLNNRPNLPYSGQHYDLYRRDQP